MAKAKRLKNNKKEDKHQAACSCGWTGDWHSDPDETTQDWIVHKSMHMGRRR